MGCEIEASNMSYKGVLGLGTNLQILMVYRVTQQKLYLR